MYLRVASTPAVVAAPFPPLPSPPFAPPKASGSGLGFVPVLMNINGRSVLQIPVPRFIAANPRGMGQYRRRRGFGQAPTAGWNPDSCQNPLPGATLANGMLMANLPLCDPTTGLPTGVSTATAPTCGGILPGGAGYDACLNQQAALVATTTPSAAASYGASISDIEKGIALSPLGVPPGVTPDAASVAAALAASQTAAATPAASSPAGSTLQPGSGATSGTLFGSSLTTPASVPNSTITAAEGTTAAIAAGNVGSDLSFLSDTFLGFPVWAWGLGGLGVLWLMSRK